VYSLEHSPEYADKTRRMLASYGLEQWATVIDAPLKAVGGSAPWYDISSLPARVTGVDLLLIDGPPASTAPKARGPAFQMLLPRLGSSFLIVLDDAARPDEMAIVADWKKSAPDLIVTTLPAEKGCTLLERTAVSRP
jgi:predicted O-methyltransferase YrrM